MRHQPVTTFACLALSVAVGLHAAAAGSSPARSADTASSTPHESAFPKPPIVAAPAWGSEPQPMGEAYEHTIEQVTLHHAGVNWKPGDDAAKKMKAMQTWGQRDKGWPDLPYHFMIAPDGTIFEARNPRYAGETNTSYSTHGHFLIQCWGNFQEQRITLAQLKSAAHLAAWAIDHYDLDRSRISGHNDQTPGETSCPGKDYDRYIDDGTFAAWVDSLLDEHHGVGEPERRVAIKLKPAMDNGPTRFVGEPLED